MNTHPYLPYEIINLILEQIDPRIRKCIDYRQHIKTRDNNIYYWCDFVNGHIVNIKSVLVLLGHDPDVYVIPNMGQMIHNNRHLPGVVKSNGMVYHYELGKIKDITYDKKLHDLLSKPYNLDTIYHMSYIMNMNSYDDGIKYLENLSTT